MRNFNHSGKPTSKHSWACSFLGPASAMSSFLDLLPVIRDKLQPPIALILGSTSLTAQLVAQLPAAEVVCYQMDLYQAARLREELAQAGLPGASPRPRTCGTCRPTFRASSIRPRKRASAA